MTDTSQFQRDDTAAIDAAIAAKWAACPGRTLWAEYLASHPERERMLEVSRALMRTAIDAYHKALEDGHA